MADDSVSVEISIEEKAALKALTALTKGVENFEKQTKTSVNKADASWASFKGNLAAIATSGVLKSIGSGLAGLVSGSIEAAASAEKISTQLEVLTGSAESAGKLFKQLTDYSAGTPFQLQGIAEASAQLLSFGFEADSVRERIGKIGEVAAGSGSDLKEIALIYGQVAAAGKLTGERLLQLQERAIPIGPALAKTMGVAEKSVRDLVSQGKVTQEVFEKAFNSMSEAGGIFEGAVSKQSKTLSGVTSTLNDNFFLLQKSIGDAFSPALISGAETLIGVLQDINKWVVENQKEIEVYTGFFAEQLQNIAGFAGEFVKAEQPIDAVNKKLLEQDEKMAALVKRKRELESSEGGLFGLFKDHDALQLKKVNGMISKLNYEMKETIKQRNELVKADAPQEEAAGSDKVQKRKQEEQQLSLAVIEERRKLNEQLALMEQDKVIAEEQAKLARADITMQEREAALASIMEHEFQKTEIIRNGEIERAQSISDEGSKALAIQAANKKQELDILKKSADAKKVIMDLEKKNQDEQLQGFAQGFSIFARLTKKNTAEYRVAASAEAVIATYLAANKALAIGPPAGPFLAAAQIALGLKNVAEINKVSFATGGIVGGGGGASSGLDNQTANVRTGEMILNAPQQRQLFDIANNRGSTTQEAKVIEITSIVQVDEREIARAVRNQRLEGFAI